MRSLVSLFDVTANEIERIFSISETLKAKLKQGLREPLLPGRVMALLFEKPSLRTRVSFETAMIHLGGGSLFLGDDVGWGQRETIADFARVLSEYVDVIVCRAKSHGQVEQLAAHSSCPVVNGLTDLCHPCQALADLLTLREVHGSLPGRKLAYVGDANNVARSLAVACGKLGVQFAIASPPGYEFDESFVERLEREVPDMDLLQTTDPADAVDGASGVYTDVWTSMGQEEQRDERRRMFVNYQVNAALMSRAPRDACFLHCLPARRGEEVTDEVIDGPQSVVIQQAANRMHAQKGLLAWLLGADV
jgi:ornithine carbamoyltransferase